MPPIGWLKPPRTIDAKMANHRLPNARYNGNAIENPSEILWIDNAKKTLNPNSGLACEVANVKILPESYARILPTPSADQ